MLQLWQHVTKPTFWLPVCSSHLTSVPPNWQRHATKKVRSFIPCHFIIFGERSDPPRNLRVPDFRDLGSRPPTSRPRNLLRARIKNSQRPPQNTRDKGNLIFHSYSKTDVRAPYENPEKIRLSVSRPKWRRSLWHLVTSTWSISPQEANFICTQRWRAFGGKFAIHLRSLPSK